MLTNFLIMRNLLIGSFIFSVLMFSPTCLTAQDNTIFYRLENGKSLSKAQLDSLSELYNNRLKFKYEREEGKTIVWVTIPEKEKLTQSIPKKIISPFDTSSVKKDVEYVFLDTLNREITRSAFQGLMKELGVHPTYSVNIDGDIKKITLRPPSSDEAKALMKEVTYKRDKLQEMIGKLFPFEKMTDIEGNTYNSEYFEGKVVVFNYWFVECAPCIREMPHLNTLVSEFRDDEEILFIAPSLSDPDKIEKMLEIRPFEYVIVPDASDHSSSVGIVEYPTHIVVNKEGKVTLVETGYHDKTIEKLRAEITRLL